MAIPTNDEIWADFNPDGVTPHEPVKQEIRRKMNFIEAMAAAAGLGAKPYPTKLAMDADTSQPDGKIGLIYADPVDTNNFPTLWYWNDAGNVWVMGTDRIGNMENRVAQSTAAVNGLYEATGALRPVAWMDTSSYEVAWPATLTSPATRFTATPTVGGLTIVSTNLMPGGTPLAVRLGQALLPGRIYYFRMQFTAGTLSGSNGFWIGTDTATTGNITTNARTLVRRGTILLPSLSNAATADGARSVTPAFAAPAVALAMDVGFLVEVQPDFSMLVKVFQNGAPVSSNVVVSDGGAPHSALMVGVVISASQTVIIEEVDIRPSTGPTLYVHSGVSSSGDGSRGAPLKYPTDIPGSIVANNLVGKPITITFLTDNVYGYVEPDDKLCPEWTLNGLPGGNTALNGFNFAEVPVWTVAASTGGKVYTTPLKHALEVVSHVNQVFVTNLAWNPRPWYTMPHKTLVSRTTANGGVDMAGDTAGSIASQGGLLYLRLPDGLPSADPGAYPTGGYGLVVARAVSLIAVKGAPKVTLNNLTLRWAAGALFTGGAGYGEINNCVFEWSGYNNPNIQVENGQYIIGRGGHSWYSDGDGVGRSPRVDMPFQNGSTLTTVIDDFEIAYTGSQAGGSGGDAVSDHILDPDFAPFDTSNRRSILYLTNVYFHDCWKCGLVTSDDEVHVNGITVERCGTEQFALLGVPSSPAVGRTQRAVVNGFKFDPQGLGTTGVRGVYTDGMALCEVDLTNGWIGTPAAGGKELELVAQPLTVSGVPQTRDITKNILRHTNVVTEREPGLVVRAGDGLATGSLTFSANPANGDTCTIGAVTYAFNTALGGANSILIGGNSTVTRNNLIGAIMADPLLIAIGYGGGTVVHPTVTALPVSNGIVAVKAKTAGTGGNAIVTTEVSTALSFGSGTLTGGVAASGTFVPVASHKLT